MKPFGGPALRLDRDDINTDEIIPARYLTEISKTNLKPHVLEDLSINTRAYANLIGTESGINVIIGRKNFGCGSSREHAVWAFEVNDINMIIAESFARIFRQNMFNCGIPAIELPKEAIAEIFALADPLIVDAVIGENVLTITSGTEQHVRNTYSFTLNDFDRELVAAGGWLAYAEHNY